MSRDIYTKDQQALSWLVSMISVLYLIIIISSFRGAYLTQLNGNLAAYLQYTPPPWLLDIMPHLRKAGYWWPYWCSVILLFQYKATIKAGRWLMRFGLFLVLSVGLTILINQVVYVIWPQICSRSASFIHQPLQHPGCRILSPLTMGTSGISWLAVLTLPKKHWLEKIMLMGSTLIIMSSQLNQGQYYPLQLTGNLVIMLFAATIAYLIYNTIDEEYINNTINR